MKPLRRRKLSTFLIPAPATSGAPSISSNFRQIHDSFEARWGISSVRYRHVLDIGLSPRQSRSSADIRLQNIQKCGWSWPNNDPKRAIQSSKGVRRFTNASGLGPRRDLKPTPPPLTSSSVNDSVHKQSTDEKEDGALLSTRSLPPISSDGLALLRRPTMERSDPVQEKGPMFQMIMKGRELKPFSFQGDDIKSGEFYEHHFPLLCHKLKDGSLPNSAITKHDVEEQLRMPSARRRAREMRERLWKVEQTLEGMEKEAEIEGETLNTELRDLAFDPTAWAWNQDRYNSPMECEISVAQ